MHDDPSTNISQFRSDIKKPFLEHKIVKKNCLRINKFIFFCCAYIIFKTCLHSPRAKSIFFSKLQVEGTLLFIMLDHEWTTLDLGAHNLHIVHIWTVLAYGL